jgi:hypothetical protein
LKDEVIELNAGKDEVMYSSFGFDTVEFSKNDGDAQRQIKKKLLECMNETINQFNNNQQLDADTDNLKSSTENSKNWKYYIEPILEMENI